MAEVTLEQVPQKLRDLFNKGFVAFERGNLDYAVELLMSCIQTEPRFLHARKFLRAAALQRLKQKKSAWLAHVIATIKNLPQYFRALGMLKSGKNREAMDLCEKMLAEDPLDLRLLTLLVKIADVQELHEVAVQTLGLARDHYPGNLDVMKLLGEQYIKSGQIKAGRECFEKLGELCPRDPDVIKALKDATAMESMQKDWSDVSEKGYRGGMKDTEEAVLLEKQAKAKKSDKDLDALIEDTVQKMEQEPENINYYRSLARLYADKKMFNEALGILEKAIELNPGDPELDNAWSAMRVRKFEQEIADLQTEGKTEAVKQKETEKAQFVFDDLQERVSRYPNDLGLRYEWGAKLFENDYIDEAIHEFQRSQRSPKHRTLSLYHMALCFKNKKQCDMAIDQLTTAGLEIAGMDDMKKDVCYELGVILELMGKPEKAAEYYKQIYQVDIGYKDIRDKIEKAYQK